MTDDVKPMTLPTKKGLFGLRQIPKMSSANLNPDRQVPKYMLARHLGIGYRSTVFLMPLRGPECSLENQTDDTH